MSVLKRSNSITVPAASCTAHGGSAWVVKRTRMPTCTMAQPGKRLVVAKLGTASMRAYTSLSLRRICSE